MEDIKKAAADLNQKTEELKSGQEPVSGEQGAGTASEPFDQGNSEGTSYAHAGLCTCLLVPGQLLNSWLTQGKTVNLPSSLCSTVSRTRRPISPEAQAVNE